jgi:uncharacterized membrane protein (UPF0182 family)
MSARRAGVVAAVSVALLLVLGRAWGAVTSEHAWYAALGADDVWWWQFRSALLLKGVAGMLGTLAMRAHLAAVRRSFVAVVMPRRVGDLEFTAEVQERALSLLLWLVALLVGVLVTLPLDDWTTVARAIDSRPIGEADPHLLRDVAFYVDILPLEVQAYEWALLSHVLMSGLVVAGYAVTRGVAVDGGALRVTRHARRHLTVLGAILLVLLAWSYRLDVFERLAGGTGPDGAFGFADKTVALPAALVLQVVTLSAAAVVSWSGWSRQPRSAIVAVTTVLLLALLLRQGLPLIADQVADGLDPVAREAPYLQARASYSQRAYDAARVAPAASADTARLEDVSEWDAAMLQRAAVFRRPRLAPLAGGVAWQGGGSAPGTYLFEEVAADDALPRWRALALDPRAADPAAALDRDDDARALPPLAVQEGATGYALARDTARRILAPRLANGVSRLAAAWGLQNPRLALGALPGRAPALVSVRDVRSRVERLAPLLETARTVTPIVALDSLWWATELYAVTGRYPLSERRVFAGFEVTAAQHAGIALVNAHTGRVAIVPDASPSPLARSWMRRLGARLVRPEDVPAALRAALPPRWEALELEGATALRHGSRRLDGAGLEVLLPESADSALVAHAPPVWLAARATWAATAAVVDSARILRGVLLAPGGRDRTVRFQPVSEGTRVPAMLDASRQAFDSLRRARTDLRRGWTRIVPAAGLVRFVTPLYATRSDGTPALDAVVVADARGVGVGTSVLAAAGPAPTPGPLPVSPDAAAAVSLYERMRAALRRGDWGAFGTAFDALGRTLGVPPAAVGP